ncbi:F-box/WD repeat-containing protein 7 isoform X1 [Pieris rapae]|uniref:F-box/WD repeat-containing protein 7 isoform X1 n=1 Tax=Pieris rapae TaxID=64459 RepID=UPI000B926882|nr:F-box/WD repeat-containing protein 7 isoform X1 [Pieris rapae]XP_022124473.1 F-box/WD repeat-containing protein 7 isoform X1 [Pieris rapae]
MEPSCSYSECDIFKGSKNSFENNVEDKIDANIVKPAEIPTENNDDQQIEDLERDDFEEENRILKHCSNMVVDEDDASTAQYSRPVSSVDPDLLKIASAETIARLQHFMSDDFGLPGCGREANKVIGSKLKEMIHDKAGLFVQGTSMSKEDFMQKLINSGKPEKKDFPKGKLYKAELEENANDSNMEIDAVSGPSGRSNSNASSIASTSSDSKDFTVPSTSNAEKLLGLCDATKNGERSSQVSSYAYCDPDDDSDEDDVEETWCTCLSSPEDEEDDDEPEPEERFWRKRRYEPPQPQSAKRFRPDGTMVPYTGEWNNSCLGLQSLQHNINQASPDLTQWLNRFQSWTNVEKIQAIDALIGRCTAGHVRHMMKAIEPLFQRDFISLLPKELALTVLGYLSPKDLLRAAQTCRYWRFLADDNLLWKEQCRRISLTTLKKRLRSMPRCASPWKAAYMRQSLIQDNWLHKPVDNPIVMRGHDDHVITCLQFYGNRILSGSDDTTLKVWSAITGKCLRTLVGHSGGVWSSQMIGDLVISGSTDRTLRVWNAKTGRCLKVLAGHTSTVRCMHLHQNRVVSGSRDATLRVWSISKGCCLRVLVGHLAAVRCVQYDGKVVVSGAYDYFVKVWNPETGECLHTLAGHTNRVYSLQFDGVHVVSGSLDTSIRVWDVESGQLKHTLTGHQSLTSGMELNSNILVSGNADSTVKVWDITTGHCLHTLSGPNKHQSAVTCLQSSNRFVITSSDDGTVKLWDVRTGEFIRNLVELGSGGSGGVVWRIRASATKLICAVGSRNGTEETKLLVLDFDVPGACRKCDE